MHGYDAVTKDAVTKKADETYKALARYNSMQLLLVSSDYRFQS
jgi:hypothetical protein